MINIIKTLTTKLNLILGFLLISYIFYLRIIVVRIPRTLYFIQEQHFKYPLFFVTVISIMISTFIIYHNVLILANIEIKQSRFSKINTKIGEKITDALIEVYNFFADLITDVYDKLSFFCNKFYLIFGRLHEALFLFLLYIIRLIILFSFLIDVFVFFQLRYFYKCLSLITFILIINFILFLLKDFASNLSTSRSFLVITPKGVNKLTNEPITNFKLKEEFKHGNLHYHVREYIRASKMSGYLDEYDRYSGLYNPYFNLFTSSLYLIGWSFILVTNLPSLIEFLNISLVPAEILDSININIKETPIAAEEPFSGCILDEPGEYDKDFNINNPKEHTIETHETKK